MTDRQAEQAAAAQVRALVMADVSRLTTRAVAPCPGCGRGAGLWCAPWCEYADPGEDCPDCGAAGDCHPWCPRREEVPDA